jgi:hypothetical protein
VKFESHVAKKLKCQSICLYDGCPESNGRFETKSEKKYHFHRKFPRGRRARHQLTSTPFPVARPPCPATRGQRVWRRSDAKQWPAALNVEGPSRNSTTPGHGCYTTAV